MVETIEQKEIDGRLVELKKFSDVCVVYAWPRERSFQFVKIEELGVFETLEEAKKFVSSLVKF